MFFIKNSFYFVKQRFFAKVFVFPRIFAVIEKRVNPPLPLYKETGQIIPHNNFFNCFSV